MINQMKILFNKSYNFRVIYVTLTNFNYLWNFGSMALIFLKIIKFLKFINFFIDDSNDKKINKLPVLKNVVLSHKKYYCEIIDLKKQIFIKTKSEEELSKIDLQKELQKWDNENDEIYIKFISNCIDQIENFKGYIVVFKYSEYIKELGEEKFILKAILFNDIFPDCCSIHIPLVNDSNYNLLKFLIKNFLCEDATLRNTLKWHISFNDYFTIDMQKKIVKFLEFKDLNEIMKFNNLEDLYIEKY